MPKIEFPEKYDGLLNDLMDRLATEARQEFEEQVLDAEDIRSSPIEKLMGLSLQYLIKSREWFASDRLNDYFYGYTTPTDFKSLIPWRSGILIIPECPIGKYRADFMVRFAGYRKKWVWGAIECDGHDHHNLTKEQAKHDRERDRAFQDAGVLILRYPGSEIWKSPLKCASDALSILERQVEVEASQALWEDYPS